MKQVLFNLTQPELEKFITDLGQPKFRTKQILEWLARGAPNFLVMKNLPESLRIQLNKIATTLPCKIIQKLTSIDEQTTKFLLKLYDGELIESVLMRTNYGNSVCISSQVGCAMGCKFCASTLLGLKRNLTTNEMLAQVLISQWVLRGADKTQKSNGDPNNNDVSHVVVMGTGEPLQNLENLKGFLERINSELNIGWRRITVSTCGIVSGINELIKWGRPINLAISLHAATNSTRNELMPINKIYNLNEVLDAAFRFSEKTGRQIMIEYILLANKNDSEQDAKNLIELLKGKNCMVNIIPWNTVSERNFIAPSTNIIHKFQNILLKNSIHVRIRRERGADINSACGQLRINNTV